MGSSQSKNIIGIDLGTEYCCVGAFKDEKVEIVKNTRGNTITPSYVALTQNGNWLVGDEAKEQAVKNPGNTIIDIKRLIGRRFDDPKVQVDKKSYWPHKVVNENGRPKIELIQNGEKLYFYAEEISAKLLAYMKEIAQIYLGSKVDYAVIAVPVNFNETQRQMTKDAAKIAGLDVLQLVNEPTASCLAYNYEKFVQTGDPRFEKYNMLVLDLGGGTLDLSLVEIVNGTARTIGSYGDTHLGGNDFNQQMIEHLLGLIKNQNHLDLSSEKSVLHLLNILCEKAKIDLSGNESTRIEINFENENYKINKTVEMTRELFERLNNDLFERIMDIVKRTLTHRFCNFSSLYHPLCDEEVCIKLIQGETRNEIKNEIESIKSEKENILSFEVDQFLDNVIRSYVKDSDKRKLKRLSDKIKSLEEKLNEEQMEIINSYCHKSNVHRFLLVGGSSKIPKIKQLLNEYFPGKLSCLDIHPDELVAYGATVKGLMNSRCFELNSNCPKNLIYSKRNFTANILYSIPRFFRITRSSSNEPVNYGAACTVILSNNTHNSSLEPEKLCFKESASMSIGIEDAYGKIDKLIVKNQILPICFTKVYTNGLKIDTTNNNKSNIMIKVYQGENEYALDNYFVGEVRLSNIGLPLKLEVNLNVFDDNSFKIKLKDLSRRRGTVTEDIILINWKERLNKNYIEHRRNENFINTFLDFERIDRKGAKMLSYRDISREFEKCLLNPIDLNDDIIKKLEKLEVNETADVEFDFPFSDCPNNTSVTQVQLIKIIPSNAKPRLFNCLPMNKKLLFKRGDNLYDDQVVMAFLHISNLIWDHSKTKFIWNRDGYMNENLISNKCYKIVPLRNSRLRCGFIEPVVGEDAENLWDRNCFLRTKQHKFNDLSNSLRPGGEDFVRLCASAIGTFVSMYLLGIADRHQGNIMLANDHSLFNIDFGYSFGETVLIDTADFPVPIFVRNYLYQNNIWDSFIEHCWNALKTLEDYQDLFESLASKHMKDNWKKDKARKTLRDGFGARWSWFVFKMSSGSYSALPKYIVHSLRRQD